MLYSLTETANILIPKEFCIKGVRRIDAFIAELKGSGIITKSRSMNKYIHNKYVLTSWVVNNYPEVQLYFENTWTDKGYYQLKVTEEGLRNIMNLIYKIEKETCDNE